MLGGFGLCATRIDDEGDDLQLGCWNAARPPACFTALLEQPSSGLRNPEMHRCGADYTPNLFFQGKWWKDELRRYGTKIPVFDRSGLTRYPVDGSKLSDSRLLVQTYEPYEHFARRLSTPAIRLSDFAPAPANESE